MLDINGEGYYREIAGTLALPCPFTRVHSEDARRRKKKTISSLALRLGK
jgi:hypothetical protein